MNQFVSCYFKFIIDLSYFQICKYNLICASGNLNHIRFKNSALHYPLGSLHSLRLLRHKSRITNQLFKTKCSYILFLLLRTVHSTPSNVSLVYEQNEGFSSNQFSFELLPNVILSRSLRVPQPTVSSYNWSTSHKSIVSYACITWKWANHILPARS